VRRQERFIWAEGEKRGSRRKEEEEKREPALNKKVKIKAAELFRYRTGS